MLQARSLTALPGVGHAFFTRDGGVSEGVYATLNGGIGSNDAPDTVNENRRRMAELVGVQPARLLSLYQIHSPDAVVVSEPWHRDARPRADAMVTHKPGLALGISTADCGPVLFADPKAQVIGAAHAGWRGALTGVLEATIAAMEKLGAERTNIVAAMGPMIRRPNYEVGPEFVARFRETDKDNERYSIPAARSGHALFDLGGFIAARLATAGMSQIEDLGFCTYAAPEKIYSYRRSTHLAEQDYGRHINAIVLADV